MSQARSTSFLKAKVGPEYKSFVEDIKRRVRASQYEALKAVNKELIALYWDIGRRIAERQKKLGWGKSVVENLAGDLQKEFPGIRGFSVQNLWRMKQFFQTYSDNEKLSPMVREIGWTHNIVTIPGTQYLIQTLVADLDLWYIFAVTAVPRKFLYPEQLIPILTLPQN